MSVEPELTDEQKIEHGIRIFVEILADVLGEFLKQDECVIASCRRHQVLDMRFQNRIKRQPSKQLRSQPIRQRTYKH
jgi:hypothetical protein